MCMYCLLGIIRVKGKNTIIKGLSWKIEFQKKKNSLSKDLSIRIKPPMPKFLNIFFLKNNFRICVSLKIMVIFCSI